MQNPLSWKRDFRLSSISIALPHVITPTCEGSGLSLLILSPSWCSFTTSSVQISHSIVPQAINLRYFRAAFLNKERGFWKWHLSCLMWIRIRVIESQLVGIHRKLPFSLSPRICEQLKGRADRLFSMFKKSDSDHGYLLLIANTTTPSSSAHRR